MTFCRTLTHSFIIVAMSLACGFAAARAQTYPARPLRLLLGLPPGGAADVAARLLAHGLEGKLGQAVVVENKPGSGGNLVGELVAKSPPDGYTLLLGPDSLFVINPHLYASMPFDPLKDLVPVASLVNNYYAFVVNSALPVKTLPDFVALAKRSDPPLFYASFGNGTQSHLGVEMLKQTAQFKLNHVPYRGGAQAGMAVVSGDASLSLGGGGVYPMIQSGQLRPLAVASRERVDELPGVPSVSEFYPSYALEFVARPVRAGRDAAAHHRPATHRGQRGDRREDVRCQTSRDTVRQVLPVDARGLRRPDQERERGIRRVDQNPRHQDPIRGSITAQRLT